MSALLNYILGVGTQNAGNARNAASPDRAKMLAAAAKIWANLDAETYAFTRTMAAPLRDHDDRVEFLAGLDLILAGISAR